MSISRQTLLTTLNQWLEPDTFQDYAPNGLQVEGTDEINKIITGVTASQALLDAAVRNNADAIVVHHGYFWKGETPCVVGMKHRRLKTLLEHNINLLAYHLPLDAHPQMGNNVGLAQALGLQGILALQNIAPVGIVYQGETEVPLSLEQFAERLSQAVERQLVAVVSGGNHQVRKVAICTGGGQGFIEQAADAGMDLFISGEISEQTVHVARERGIHYIAAGHHATERFGARSLGQKLATDLGIDVEFIDIDSPA